jgi:hypothetical protein
MTHSYARALSGPAVQDAALGVAWLVVAFLQEPGPFRTFLLVAIPAAVAWGAATLHFPARVEIDEEGVAFARYGRVHRFAWGALERVRVRRFLVRDRVLVRLDPSPAWRGRYWLVDSIDGFDALVAALEARRR